MDKNLTPSPSPLDGEGEKNAIPPPRSLESLAALPVHGEGEQNGKATGAYTDAPLQSAGEKNPHPNPPPNSGEGVKHVAPSNSPANGEGEEAKNLTPTPSPLDGEGSKESVVAVVSSPDEKVNGKHEAAALKILGLITARGGSKSVPRKNILPVAGRPLLAYTCEAAKGSRHISRVILSTDDDEIAEVGRANGVEVPFKRPAELAQDDTPSIAVAQHALKWLADNEGWQADILVLLQPTSPLRKTRHIDEALDAMLAAKADTAVSVVAVPHPFSPYKVMELRDGLLHPFWTQPLPFDPTRRQNVPTLYARNGPAVLASRAGVIEGGSFYGQTIVPYVMTEADSVDVDTPFDLRVVEWLLSSEYRVQSTE